MGAALPSIGDLARLVDRLPVLGAARARFDAAVRRLSEPTIPGLRVDYSRPAGDPGIFGPASVAWRVHANGVTMFVGGITAVLLELAEPRVRSGVWDHSDFRTDPVGRMRRTGMAAMVTTYGPVADVERVTGRVRRMHERITGVTPEGEPYRADDPELLRWVHVTAVYGFLRAYVRYADPGLSRAEQDRYYAESVRGAAYYGATGVPTSVATAREYLRSMRPRLRPHPIVHEFLDLVSNAPVLSASSLPVQRLLVQAGIDALPAWARSLLGLGGGQAMRVAARPVVRSLAAFAALVLRDGIPEQARRRAAA